MVDHVFLTLKRFATDKYGTKGVLLHHNEILCFTLEEPWRDNRRNVSCIPDGLYRCTKYHGTRHKNVFYVHDVPERSAILIHTGNDLSDTAGCILVGRQFSPHGISYSRQALDILNKELPYEFYLNIKEV